MTLGRFVNKLVITVFSILIFVAGIVVIAVGSITIDRHSKYVEQFAQGTVAFPIIALIFGIFITLNGLCGFYGAVGNNPTCLNWYAIAGTLLFIGELAGGIIVLTSPDDTEKKIKEQMDKEFRNYFANTDEHLPSQGSEAKKKEDKENYRILDENTNKIINTMQERIQCCGHESYNDWKEKYNLKYPPQSCCKDSESCDTSNPDLIYKEGCYRKTIDLVGGAVHALGYLAILLACIQLVVICMACALARSKKPDRIIR